MDEDEPVLVDESAAGQGPSRAGVFWRWVERLVFLGVLVFAGSRLGPQIGAALGVGRDLGTVPPFAVESLDGDLIASEGLLGQVVLVNFWATWCGPCRFEMPGFQKVYDDFREDGFVILGLSTDRGGRSVVDAYLEERGVTYPIAMSTHDLEQAFGGIRGLPMSFLIDRAGNIRHRVFGYFAGPTLRLAVGRLLDEEGPDPALSRAEAGGSRAGLDGAGQAKSSP